VRCDASLIKTLVKEAPMPDVYQVSRASLLGAISLLLGAITGWFGGRMGAVEPTLFGAHGTDGRRNQTRRTETILNRS
jgi:hypothetical protein